MELPHRAFLGVAGVAAAGAGVPSRIPLWRRVLSSRSGLVGFSLTLIVLLAALMVLSSVYIAMAHEHH